jgi:hypothetical protein
MEYQQHHLSVEVITNNPTDWKFAPVLVASNLERINLSAAKQAVTTTLFMCCSDGRTR